MTAATHGQRTGVRSARLREGGLGRERQVIWSFWCKVQSTSLLHYCKTNFLQETFLDHTAEHMQHSHPKHFQAIWQISLLSIVRSTMQGCESQSQMAVDGKRSTAGFWHFCGTSTHKRCLSLSLSLPFYRAGLQINSPTNLSL